MCNKRIFDAVAIVVGVLVGILAAVLAFLDLLVAGTLIPIIGALIGGVAFALMVLAAGSPLRQNATYNNCLCFGAPRVLVSAALLVAVAVLALILAAPALFVTLILYFFLFALVTYTVFALFCVANCMCATGCDRNC